MPANMPIMCLICNLTLKGDAAFLSHMQNTHGTQSPDQAMAKDKAIQANVPKQAPIALDKETPPSAEFMEMAKMLDQGFPSPVPNMPPPAKKEAEASSRVIQGGERGKSQPITLTYKYEGACPTCATSVRTIVVRVKGQTVAIALCITHGQLKEQEVADLEEKKYKTTPPINNQYMQDIVQVYKTKRKEAKKRGKQSKSKLFNKVTVQSPVSAS